MEEVKEVEKVDGVDGVDGVEGAGRVSCYVMVCYVRSTVSTVEKKV